MEGAVSSPRAAARVGPESVVRSFATALGLGQLDVASGCFAREACLITPDATMVRGRDGIRPILAQLILVRTEIAVQLSNVVVATDVALLRGHWTICSNGVAGTRFEQTTNPFLVVHRIEGEWKLQIAAPWG